MISLQNLKEHCRTCLIRLEENNIKKETTKFKNINFYPELKSFMSICLGNSYDESRSMIPTMDEYIPYLCRLCFVKWQDFLGHRQLAVQSDLKLRKILEKEQEIESKPHEIILEKETRNDLFVFEKCETNCSSLPRSRSNSPTNRVHQEISRDSPLDFERQSDSSPPPSINSIDSSEDNIPIKDLKKSKKSKESLHIKKVTRKKKQKNIIEEKDSKLNATKPSKTITKKAHYRCSPCKKYFYEIRKYEAHVKQVHEGAQKPFQCKLCDKAYKFHKTLVDHITLNHSDKPLETYKCEMCNNIFKTQITLKAHIQNKHPDSDAESRRVICDQCGFLAVNQISLKKHIKNRHTLGEELKCDECPKVFKNQYYLKYHKMNFHNHLNIKPFQCGECDMSFTRLALLNTHKRSHLDRTQRIKCDFEGCDVRFLQQAEKRRHMRLVHLKVKQYVCDICGAAFGTKPTLRHHRYIHTNEKPYKCSICGQGFRQRSAMKTHGKIHLGKTKAKEDKNGGTSWDATAGENMN